MRTLQTQKLSRLHLPSKDVRRSQVDLRSPRSKTDTLSPSRCSLVLSALHSRHFPYVFDIFPLQSVYVGPLIRSYMLCVPMRSLRVP